jgi:hypothetical protein
VSCTRFGIAGFVLAVVAGPLYTVPGYSPAAHLISELAAQHTPNHWVMSVAFVVLGGAVVVDARRRPVPAIVPFAAFGSFMALAGLFGHQPITPGVDFDPALHRAHAVLATLAGVSITLALAWQAVRERATSRRIAAGALAVLCLALPLAMLAWPAVQGLIQRFMYAALFVWLWRSYPGRVHA